MIAHENVDQYYANNHRRFRQLPYYCCGAARFGNVVLRYRIELVQMNKRTSHI